MQIDALAQHDFWHPESWSPSVFDDYKHQDSAPIPATSGSGSDGGKGNGTMTAAALLSGNSTVAAALKATLNETAFKVAAFQGGWVHDAGEKGRWNAWSTTSRPACGEVCAGLCMAEHSRTLQVPVLGEHASHPHTRGGAAVHP